MVRQPLMRLAFLALLSTLLPACSGASATMSPRQTTPAVTAAPLATPIPASTAPALPATVASSPTPDAAGFAATGTAALREESRVPFPAPASCAAVAMHGPEKRRDFPAYWYDGNGIAIGNATAVFYAHDNKVMWQVQDDARPTITGERIDAVAPPMIVQNLGLTSGGYISGVVFAQPGCWHLHAVAGTQMLDAHFYVYPSGCIPSNMRDPSVSATPTPCIAPTSVAATCPMTQPPNPPLMPPPAITDQPGTYGFWYGNDAVWVVLAKDGTTRGGKFGWWRTAHGSLAITGRRLDMIAPPLHANIPDGYGESGFQVSGLDFPTTGCWEVTGTVAGRELRFVITVVPPLR